MPNLGDPVLMTATYRDSSGALVDATSVVLTVTAPDGTVTTPSYTHPGTGIYTYNYFTTLLGFGSWAYTSSDFGGIGDVFNVSLPAQTLASVTDAKDHINYGTGTTDDTEIRRKLRTATAYVNSNCGYSIPTSVTESVVVSSGGSLSLVLTQWPLISVDSITPLVPSAGVPTPNVATTVVDSNASIVTLNTGLSFYGSYRVVYTVGRQDADGNTVVPDDLQELCLEYFKWLWETQRGAAFTSQGTPGFSEGDEASGAAMLPPRVYAILADYVRPHV